MENKFNIVKPSGSDKYDVQVTNKNFELVSEHLSKLYEITSSIPELSDIPTKISELEDNVNIVTVDKLETLISSKVEISQYKGLVSILQNIRETVAGLSKVASTGNYEDLLNKPDVGKYINYTVVKRGL